MWVVFLIVLHGHHVYTNILRCVFVFSKSDLFICHHVISAIIVSAFIFSCHCYLNVHSLINSLVFNAVWLLLLKSIFANGKCTLGNYRSTISISVNI